MRTFSVKWQCNGDHLQLYCHDYLIRCLLSDQLFLPVYHSRSSIEDEGLQSTCRGLFTSLLELSVGDICPEESQHMSLTDAAIYPTVQAYSPLHVQTLPVEHAYGAVRHISSLPCFHVQARWLSSYFLLLSLVGILISSSTPTHFLLLLHQGPSSIFDSQCASPLHCQFNGHLSVYGPSHQYQGVTHIQGQWDCRNLLGYSTAASGHPAVLSRLQLTLQLQQPPCPSSSRQVQSVRVPQSH